MDTTTEVMTCLISLAFCKELYEPIQQIQQIKCVQSGNIYSWRYFFIQCFLMITFFRCMTSRVYQVMVWAIIKIEYDHGCSVKSKWIKKVHDKEFSSNHFGSKTKLLWISRFEIGYTWSLLGIEWGHFATISLEGKNCWK